MLTCNSVRSTTLTCTLYFNPKQGFLHRLECEVNPESGSHKVLSSIILFTSLARSQFGQEVAYWRERYGAANVRAYIVSEVSL